MKKKIAITLIIILSVIIIKFLFNIAINSIFIFKYNKGIYSELELNILNVINFPQGYVCDYNYGNVLYKEGKYENAIEKYKKALEENILHNEECKIRINYALSICNTVSVDEKNADSIKKAIEKYESAIEILVEEDCAGHDNKVGHDINAEQLKKDIEKEIDRLKKLLDNKNDKDDNQKDDKDDKQDTELEKKLKDIEDKIQEIKQEALDDQKDTENRFKKREFTLDRVEKNW